MIAIFGFNFTLLSYWNPRLFRASMKELSRLVTIGFGDVAEALKRGERFLHQPIAISAPAMRI